MYSKYVQYLEGFQIIDIGIEYVDMEIEKELELYKNRLRNISSRRHVKSSYTRTN